jgi:large subunit ribosomal protein L4
MKTKRMLEFLARLQMGASVLVVIPEANERIEKSSRNLPGVKVLRCEGLNVYDLLHYRQVLFTQEALQKVTERLTA